MDAEPPVEELSRSTAYRYIDVLACLVPGLREVLERAEADGPASVISDDVVFSSRSNDACRLSSLICPAATAASSQDPHRSAA
jgi:hypothetical protein